jgi:hypothetical protein
MIDSVLIPNEKEAVNEVENGLKANLQDHYFLRQSDKIAQGFVDTPGMEFPALAFEERKEEENMLF